MTRGRLAVLAALLGLALSAPAAVAATPRTSLTAVEDALMCPSCREPLAVAQSPQAEAERNYVRGLIAQGMDERQIEANLVAQYGEAVLARPPARGFNLTIYILPAVILLAGAALLAVVLPRWRRAARARRAQPAGAGPAITPRDALRLDEELQVFDG